ncbi:MAG: N-acetylmuramoyl-L-alanine amidase [Bacillus sp. (in: firmicutes)]
MYKRYILFFCMILIMTAAPTPFNAKTDDMKGTATADSLKLREGPSTDDAIIDVLQEGDTVEIIESAGQWLNVKHGDQIGWVHGDYIKVEQQLDPSIPSITITGTSLAVRKSPTSNSEKVAEVHKGETYPLIETEGYWHKIELSGKQKGWVASWLTERTATAELQIPKDGTITITTDGAPLRKTASLDAEIVKTADLGDEFEVTAIENGMYEVKRSWWRKAYIAGWLAEPTDETPAIKKKDSNYNFEQKTIVIDPGHGGVDSGAIGPNGTLEKELTSITAELLKKKLQASGANVIVTREGDRYQSLSERVRLASVNQADAFLSLHYDSAESADTEGVTVYYFHGMQKPLAQSLNKSFGTVDELNLRGVRSGNYQVIRTNSQPAVLLELGYLSNAKEETVITSLSYQSSIVTAIYNGLGEYFNGN